MNSQDELQKLDWLQEIIDKFSNIPKSRRNLIEIAGYPSWENVNSNILAFYLDKDEEHKFSTLFFDSLLDLLEQKLGGEFKRILFEEESFSIDREFPTNKGNRIDLLIKQIPQSDNDKNSWSIIIENKIHATLYNDLLDYGQSVNSQYKLVVILSLQEINDSLDIVMKLKRNSIICCNITHKEFIQSITHHLPNYYFNSDDRHLLFLKEYIANINSHYKDQKAEGIMDDILKLFHDKADEIKKFHETDSEVLKHISESLFRIMLKYGFTPATTNISKTKHFYPDINHDAFKDLSEKQKQIAKKFRFWFNIDRMKYNKSLIAGYELHGKDNTKHGDKLLNILSDYINIFTNYINPGEYGNSVSSYQWIYSLNITLDDFTSNGYEFELENKLKEEFFEHENKFLKVAIEELEKIIEANN